jgi:tetratricopeptide (TPR) repeat protein
VPTLLYHTNLGTVLLEKRQYDRAETEFLMALRFDKDSPQALSGLAVLYEAKGEPEKALEIMRRLVALDAGTDQGALIKLAEIFIQLGRPEDGVLYLEALRLPPEARDKAKAGLLIAQGIVLAASGRPRETDTALLQALRLDPTSTLAMQELFSLYDAQGRAAALEPRLRQALARDPRLPMQHNWLGLALKRKGDMEGAQAEFERALAIAPDLVGTMANLGSLYLQTGKIGEAEAILQRAVEKAPANIESRTNLIVALGMNHDLEGARRQVEKAAELGLRTPLFYNALAYALHVNGRDEEALGSLRDALRIDPRQPDALRLQAEIESARRSMDPYR